MGLSSIKKILSRHRFLILEGFWGAGKSTIAHYLRDQIGVINFPEPQHAENKMSDSEISTWYKAQHESRWKKALSLLRRKRRPVICERSILSSAAFEYAAKGHLSEIMKKRIQQIFSCRSAVVIYLKPTRALIAKGITRLHDLSVLHQLRKKPDFISKYHKFFYKILPRDFNMRNIQYLKTTDRLLKCLRKKINEVSAAGVVIYGNKVLVLFDKKYKHFVLPQGHRKIGESLIQTVKREIIEETGYTDMIYLKKLYSYQYHFPCTNKTVFKLIHVYFLRLLTTKKKRQALENHEMYGVRLIPIHSAITMLHWPQDRLVIKMAMREIKKAPIR